MKFPIVFALLAAATAVMAETNAERFARGLSPNAPVRRDPTRVDAARRHKPSGKPKCKTGTLQCCSSSGYPTDDNIKKLLKHVGEQHVDEKSLCGQNCSGMSGSSCNGETLCCDNNEFNGIISIGCSPIDIDI